MGLKLVKGHTFDLNLDPSKLEAHTRDEVGKTYFNFKLAEAKRWVVFYSLLGVVAVLSLASFFEQLLVLPAALVFFVMVKRHFLYLKDWSRWNKYARRSVVRMALPKEPGIVQPPFMPWIKIK